MSTPVRLLAFVAGLLAVFGVAAGVGNAVGPLDAEPEAEHARDGGHADDAGGHGGHEEGAEPAAHLPGGLMVSQDGYTLALERTTLAPGRRTVAFAITGPDGEPVTSYEEEHDKDLHLIAVRRDLTGFQHVHPVLDDGRWTAELDLDPAQWRLFADFTPIDSTGAGGPSLTLGADVVVPGDVVPVAEPAASRTAEVGGYEVTLDGDLVPGTESELTVTVSKDGEPVTDLQPYLAAYGHLVALRAGDLAYLHVHPDGEPGDGVTPAGPDVTFLTEVPSAGAYRLFLDFRHDGVVRTAVFPVVTS